MSLFVPALVLLLIAALLVVLLPLRRPAPPVADDAHEELREEYTALLASIRELDDAVARGEADATAAERERLRLQGRAARTLAALEALPEAPTRPLSKPVWPAALSLAGAALLVGAGAVTFLPRWQLAGLGPGERTALTSALDVPRLQRAAERSNTEEAHLALARANFSAGRFQDAARAYANVLRENPRRAEALRRVGAVLLQDEEKLREAYQFISLGAQLDPDSDEGQLFLGFALARVGDASGALKALERYRSLNPRGRDADELIATLRSNDSQTDLAAATYAQNCASCHGSDGQGGVGPSLRASRLGEEAIRAVIRNGAAGMPAYDSSELSNQRLAALVKLLRGWQGER